MVSPKPKEVAAPSKHSRGQKRLRHSSAFRKFTASLQADEPSSVSLPESSSGLPSIWAVDIAEDLILLGCDNGRVEVEHPLAKHKKEVSINNQM